MVYECENSIHKLISTIEELFEVFELISTIEELFEVFELLLFFSFPRHLVNELGLHSIL